MKIQEEKIEKLRILKINQNSLLVENRVGQKGIIHITEISNSYIVSLTKIFSVGDAVYGYLISQNGYKRFYSLKVGHITEQKKKIINETGGGYLGLKHLLYKLEENENKTQI